MRFITGGITIVPIKMNGWIATMILFFLAGKVFFVLPFHDWRYDGEYGTMYMLSKPYPDLKLIKGEGH